MSIIEQIRALILPPSDLVIAARRLEEHKRKLLDAKESKNYADKMMLFYEKQIADLTEHLKQNKPDE